MGDDGIVFPDQTTSTSRPEEQPVKTPRALQVPFSSLSFLTKFPFLTKTPIFAILCNPRPQVPGKVSSLTIVLVVLALVLSLAILGCLIFWWRRNRRRASKKDQQAEPVNLSMSGTLGSAYGHTRGAFPGPESQSLLSSRKSSTVTNQTMERAEEMMMEGRVSQAMATNFVDRFFG